MVGFVDIFILLATFFVVAIAFLLVYMDVRSIKKHLLMKQMIKVCKNRHNEGLTTYLADTQDIYFNKNDCELLVDMWNVPGYTLIVDATSITKRLNLSWQKASQ